MFHRNKNKGGIHLRRSEVNVLNPPLLFRKHTLCHRRADWLQWHNNMVCSQAERVPGLVGQARMMGRRLQDEVMAVLKQVRTADQLQQKRFPFSYLKKKLWESPDEQRRSSRASQNHRVKVHRIYEEISPICPNTGYLYLRPQIFKYSGSPTYECPI